MFKNLLALKILSYKNLNPIKIRLLQKINLANEESIALMYRICFELLPGSLHVT